MTTLNFLKYKKQGGQETATLSRRPFSPAGIHGGLHLAIDTAKEKTLVQVKRDRTNGGDVLDADNRTGDTISRQVIASHILTPIEVELEIARYEQLVGMSSEEYLDHQKKGAAPDTFEARLLGMLIRNR